MKHTIRNTALATALGLALAAPAGAQDAPTPSQRKELDAARAQLDQAAQRYAELTRKYGGDRPIRIEQRTMRKPVLGVVLAPDDAAGVRIAGITPDSAAAGAGLRSGDRIVRIDGKPLAAATGEARVSQARELLAALDDKTPVNVGYERDGKPATVSVTPRLAPWVMVMDRENEAPGGAPGTRTFVLRSGDRAIPGVRDIELEKSMVAPDVRFEIMRVGKDCDGKPCDLPVLAEAFRWNGLNLAALDGQLGRYFGASEGVLVLSTGKDLDGLQAGDVIQRIGGKPVRSPREAMDLLRAQPAESKVAVDYLRDRAPGMAQLAVPKALPFTLPKMPAPPYPPPMDGGKVEKRKIVMVDKDGKRQEWEGDAGDTPPAWVQAMPRDAQRVEKRVQGVVDDKGNRVVVDGDDLPSPPPRPLPPPPPKVD